MKRLFRITMIAVISVMFLSGAGFAMPLSDEYETLNVNTFGAPTYTAGTDLGYFIWTDDMARKNWHIRWSGEGPDTFFSGNISLVGNEFDEFVEFKFEDHGGSSTADTSFNTADWAEYFALANVGEDGLDFSINNLSAPGYVGFDLKMTGNENVADNIYFGPNKTTVASLGSDGDFKVAAPVPEPTTMLLFGLGLLGIVGLGRKKQIRKS
ncbi:MAG: PEP-CTERM sorting domain-containing protein [Thermodesulfobacteriota bacterium]